MLLCLCLPPSCIVSSPRYASLNLSHSPAISISISIAIAISLARYGSLSLFACPGRTLQIEKLNLTPSQKHKDAALVDARPSHLELPSGSAPKP